MTTPTMPMPIQLHTDRDAAGGAAAPDPLPTPCADSGRCDRARCGQVERVERHCPSPTDPQETPV